MAISGCSTHFLALERNDIPSLAEWDFEQVMEWFTKIGLGASSNVIKYKQINGA